MKKLSVILFLLSVFAGCSKENQPVSPAGREPRIEPDYNGVTIPWNIAPMNFRVMEEGKILSAKVKSPDGEIISVKIRNGIVRFPMHLWKKMLAESQGNKIDIEISSEKVRFDPVTMYVSRSAVDPWLCYRLLYPGYESWVDMKIVQRSTESFREKSVVENQLLKEDCVNCHSFRKNDPSRFLIHVRGKTGGTYISDGDKIIKTNLRTPDMKANAVYPAWHPSGKYIAFSSNKTVQSFHMLPEKNIEVSDMFSSLVIYDIEKNQISPCPDDDTIKYMDTYPAWSPDGMYLYFCRSIQIKPGTDIRKVKYNLARRSFDTTSCTFGKAEIIFNAEEKNKSVSFPAVSPDGNSLVFTLHDYGTFSIWHKEADLYSLDLKTMKADSLKINSHETESFHSWSSDGRWLVFSSKRGDGLTARPYFAYFAPDGTTGKPFVLPQEDPALYSRLDKTFNRPELIKGSIKYGPRDFMRISKDEAVKAIPAGK